MEPDLKGKVVWVTGGGTGIGRETARVLAQDGARVVISGRRVAELEHTAAQFSAQGLEVNALALDVANADAVAKASRHITETFGAVSVLVCSAGTNMPNRFWNSLTPEGYSQIVGANLSGVVHCVHSVMPAMRAQRDGVVVILSSWAGREFLPIAGMAYGATKAGLSPLTESINFEEGRNGIRATLIMPGEVATLMMRERPVPPSDEDLARMLQPEDLASLIRYVVLTPRHVCVGEVLIGPTWNRIYIGADDMRPRL